MLKGLHNHWTKKEGCLLPKRAFASKDDCIGIEEQGLLDIAKFLKYILGDLEY